MNTLARLDYRPGFLALLFLGLFSITGFAASLPEAGIVVMSTGETAAQGADNVQRALNRRAPVFVGDRITTGADAQLQLRMKDGAVIALGPNTEFLIRAYSDQKAGDKQDAALLKLMQGGLRTITGTIDKSTYRMETPVATLGIRGTVFDVYVRGDGSTTVVLRDGAVDVTGETGVVQRLDLKGLAVVVQAGKPPSKPGPIPADVLEYLKKFIPDLPDDVTWQTNEDGSTTLNLGDDIINIINTPPPAETGDGSVPGEQEPPPVEAPPNKRCFECDIVFPPGA